MIRITELYASAFGKLNDFKLSLSDGINVIYGQNEAGKTTITHLVSALLFGMCSRATKVKMYLDEYYKYIPWSLGAYGGYICIEKDGRNIKIERSLLRDHESVKVFDLDAGKDITDSFSYNRTLRQRDPAEEILGLSREMFSNTIFSAQGELKLSSAAGDALKEKISADASALSSNMSLKKAIDTLKKQGDALGTVARKGSPIGSAAQNVKIFTDEVNMIDSACERREKTIGEIAELKNELKNLSGQETKLQMQIDACLFERSEARRGDILKPLLKYKDFTPAKTGEVRRLLKRGDTLKRVSGVMTAAFFLGLSTAGISFVLSSLSVLIAGAVLTLIGGIGWMSAHTAEKHSAKSARSKLRSLNISENRLRECEEGFAALQSAAVQLSESREDEYDGQLKRLFDLKQRLNEHKLSVSNGIAYLEASLKEAAYREKSDAAADLAAAQSELNELLKRAAAVTTAIEHLKAASENIAGRFAPYMSERLSQTVAKVTDGAYARAYMDLDMNISLFDGARTVGFDSLSIGTQDMLFILSRIAMTDFLSQDALPTIFDDSFNALDDLRLFNLLDVVASLNRQVLLFTCQEREAQVLKELGTDVNMLEL